MRTVVRHHVKTRNLRVQEIRRRRLFRPVQKFFAIDDLQDAALIGAVAEIDAVTLRSRRHHAVQRHRYRPVRAGLLPRQTKVADEHRVGRIGEVVDLGHAVGAPTGHTGDEVSNAGVAFPPAFMCSLQILDHGGQQRRFGRIGHIPDFMGGIAKHPQHVPLALDALGQRIAATHAHHLRAALFCLAGLSRNMRQLHRLFRIGHINNRGAVVLGLAV